MTEQEAIAAHAVYLPIVRGETQAVVERIGRIALKNMRLEPDDLHSEGRMMLYHLLRRADQLPPKSYIRLRAKGCALDLARKHDRLSRRVRARAKKIEELEQTLQRKPTDAEIQKAFGMSDVRYSKLKVKLEHYCPEPLFNLDGEPLAIPDEFAELPYKRIIHRELVEKMMSKVSALCTPLELKYIHLKYTEGRPIQEVAKGIGKSQRMANYIGRNLLTKLRCHML